MRAARRIGSALDFVGQGRTEEEEQKEEEKTERDERGDEREKSSTHREVFAVKAEKTSRVCGDWVRARVQIYGLVVRLSLIHISEPTRPY